MLLSHCRKFSPFPVVIRRHLRTLFIQSENTPNENALIFKFDESLLPLALREKTFDFASVSAAIKSPLASKLFEMEAVRNVFIADKFVTVSKDANAEWQHVKPFIFSVLTDFITLQKPILNRSLEAPDDSFNSDSSALNTVKFDAAHKETVAMIAELFDSRIRPAIQQDGGDLEFLAYDDGVVSVRLQGSCKSCSSSVVTLKGGVENMLKHYIPEVKAVENVDEQDPLELIRTK